MGPKVDKAFLSLGTKPVLGYSLEAFEQCEDVDAVVLVVRKDRVDAARGMAQMFGCSKVTRVVAGGRTRQQSVQNGLDAMPEEVAVVSVHDGARPCVTPELISETIKGAKRNGSGVAAVKMTDTVKNVEKGYIVANTVDRKNLWTVQTPQSFKVGVLRDAFEYVEKKKLEVTDEAEAVELAGQTVRLVPASSTNVKITTADDLAVCAALLRL